VAAKEQGAAQIGMPIYPLRLIHELQSLLMDDMTVICDVISIYICIYVPLYVSTTSVSRR